MEVKIMEFTNSLGLVVADYERYVRSQEVAGKDAVSFFKFAFGQY